MAAEEFGTRLFGQASMPDGIVTTDASMTVEKAMAIKVRFEQMIAGLSKADKVAVMSNGASFQQSGIPPEDTQFLETRNYQDVQIAVLYRVPPHLVSIVQVSTSWGSGIEEQNKQFVEFTLRPWIERVEQAITTWLLPERDRQVKNSVSIIDPGRGL